ncbi:MAG TPA: TspO/MBR family protein [Corynebacterium sp.]|nr:TspO/MBR family protein [Corynebacterium sp.]
MFFRSELKKYTGPTTVATTGAVAACAALGTVLTDPAHRWHRSLRKPAWQPPAAFPVAWTLLHLDIAAINSVVLTDLIHCGQREAAEEHAAALGANLALNAGWCGIFFRARRPWLATLSAGALALSSADLTRRAYRSAPIRGVALAPYVVWTACATVLSTAIAVKN